MEIVYSKGENNCHQNMVVNFKDFIASARSLFINSVNQIATQTTSRTTTSFGPSSASTAIRVSQASISTLWTTSDSTTVRTNTPQTTSLGLTSDNILI
ncbi:hypothetical protein BpHYR1_037323 [Brachionus plicatilis]|uniref:Uncharacterized protein n=1 Tax=Brachionus plicatilis TaxID=10195 RepID=A0A3M7RYQ9_BRAPC|nr:hypothetical protein BpHYR1_037323 [Brachionus plicatilis]